jgi:hypothetical protein
MPLEGKNFKLNNKLVFQILKLACIMSHAWTWIQSFDRTANGRKGWLVLVAHYDGTGELNKHVEKAKGEISRLHFKNEKVFPFEKFVTKIKENLHVLLKDKSKALTKKQMAYIHSKDASIATAKVNVYQNYRSDFDTAVEFMSGLILSIYTAAQLDYANQHSGNKRRDVSAMGSNDQRSVRGRARQGGGRIGQRSGRSSDGGETAADADVATNARHSRITLILLTLTGISPRTSGNVLGLVCAQMSYSCMTAAVKAAVEATRVTKGATQMEAPAVCPQRRRTLTIPLTQQMRRPISRSDSCPKFLSEALRTVAVSAVAPTIPDSRGQVAHVRCTQSF